MSTSAMISKAAAPFSPEVTPGRDTPENATAEDDDDDDDEEEGEEEDPTPVAPEPFDAAPLVVVVLVVVVEVFVPFFLYCWMFIQLAATLWWVALIPGT